MCGICGFHVTDARSRLNQSLLKQMRDCMIHRGPDDVGLCLSPDGQVGLANRRLSIIDLSPQGHQPMSNEDGTVWVTYNGEIYNFRELRKELLAKGYPFRSGTDTEVLLHLYEELGEEMVHSLRGMFVFAIWDSKQKKLFLARDRLGIKPLYYAFTDGCFVFASEIKAILQSGLVDPRLNHEALHQFLSYGKIMPPLTLFQGIHKLEPGHTLTLDGTGRLGKRCYWDIPVKSQRKLEDEEVIITGVLDKLRESVRMRLISDVPVGVFLSGGVDSSLVTALVAEAKEVPLRTFTLGFRGYEQFNEFPYARQVARLLGAEHHEILIDAQDVIEFFPKFLEHQEEPVANPIWMAIYFVSKLARDHGVKVMLSGDGGDELFAGYDKWMQYLKLYHRVWKYYGLLPQGIRRLNYRIVGPLLQPPRIQDLLRRAASNEELFQGGTVFKQAELGVLLTPDFQNTYTSGSGYQVIQHLREQYDQATDGQGDYLNWMSYVALKTGLLEDFLMRLDKMGMAASIEGRVPLLDHEFVEMAFSIPPELKYKHYEQKRLLKKVAARLLPEELVYRKKVGFCAPLEEWLLGEMKDHFEQALFSLLEEHPEIFRREGLLTLYSRFQHGQGNPGAFWSLINFALWHQQWMKGSGYEA